MAPPPVNPFYTSLKARRYKFDPEEVANLFAGVSEDRVEMLTRAFSEYISKNLPRAVEKRRGLSDYRINPYVLMASSSVMRLNQPDDFASFLFNSKLYMALETSFGKSIESIVSAPYPIDATTPWVDPPEKEEESVSLAGLSGEEKAGRRLDSVWREIDKSVVVGDRRYLVSIKSGPRTINDTQVQAMTQAILSYRKRWLEMTRHSNPNVQGLDVVLGLTYGTPKTTNNKENQVLAKLLENGFVIDQQAQDSGVLIDTEVPGIRVYRVIGQEFWAFVGNPEDRLAAPAVFLEVLLGLARALAIGFEEQGLEERLNAKLRALSLAIANLRFPRGSLPDWIRNDFSEDELFWFATAMTAFYDEGI